MLLYLPLVEAGSPSSGKRKKNQLLKILMSYSLIGIQKNQNKYAKNNPKRNPIPTQYGI
jgi:hypothetical protein